MPLNVSLSSDIAMAGLLSDPLTILISPANTWHCVVYGVKPWSGVLEWSRGVELVKFWSDLNA